MAQKQTTRASSRNPVDTVDAKETPVVNAPLDVQAPTTAAEKLADALSAGEPWMERELQEHRNAKKLEAKKKAIRDQIGVSDDPEEEVEDMGRVEAEAYMDTAYSAQAKQAEAELAQKQEEWANQEGVDVKAQTDAWIDRQIQELDTDEEVNAYLPMLERQRAVGLKAAKKKHLKTITQESRESLGIIAKDIADQGKSTKKMVDLVGERAGKMRGMTKEEGVEILTDQLGERAVREGNPELLDGLVQAGYGDDASKISVKLEKYQHKARMEQIKGENAQVASEVDRYETMVDNGEFSQEDVEAISNHPQLRELYSTKELGNMKARSHVARQASNDAEEETASYVEAFDAGVAGTRHGKDLTKDTSANLYNEYMGQYTKYYEDQGDEPGTARVKAFDRLLRKAGENGSQVTLPQLEDRLSGFTTEQSPVDLKDGEVPAGVQQAWGVWQMAEGNDAKMSAVQRHMPPEAEKHARMMSSFYETTSPDMDDEERLKRAYTMKEQAIDNAMTPEDYESSELSSKVEDMVDEANHDTSWWPFSEGAEKTPGHLRAAVREKAHDYARLTGNPERARELAVKSVESNYSKLRGVYVNHGGKGLDKDADEVLEKEVSNRMDQYADYLDMDTDALDAEDITFHPDPNNPAVMMPYYQQGTPIVDYPIDIVNKRKQFDEEESARLRDVTNQNQAQAESRDKKRGPAYHQQRVLDSNDNDNPKPPPMSEATPIQSSEVSDQFEVDEGDTLGQRITAALDEGVSGDKLVSLMHTDRQKQKVRKILKERGRLTSSEMQASAE